MAHAEGVVDILRGIRDDDDLSAELDFFVFGTNSKIRKNG